MNWQLVLGAAVLCVLLAATVGAAPQNSREQNQSGGSKDVRSVSPQGSTTTTESDEGEKRFQMHCGRCHVPPEDLSPREAKAVIRQMRVRANLTAEDERLILKYLAP
jgi:cytochrome c5